MQSPLTQALKKTPSNTMQGYLVRNVLESALLHLQARGLGFVDKEFSSVKRLVEYLETRENV